MLLMCYLPIGSIRKPRIMTITEHFRFSQIQNTFYKIENTNKVEILHYYELKKNVPLRKTKRDANPCIWIPPSYFVRDVWFYTATLF